MAVEAYATIGVLSMVVACLSYTLTESALFARLRNHARAASPWLGALLSCGYCTGHWIALALVLAYRPRPLSGWWLLDYFCAVLMVAWLAAFQWIAMTYVVRLAGR